MAGDGESEPVMARNHGRVAITLEGIMAEMDGWSMPRSLEAGARGVSYPSSC